MMRAGSKNPKANSSESGTKPTFGSLARFLPNKWAGTTLSQQTHKNSICLGLKSYEQGLVCCMSAWNMPITEAYQNGWAFGSTSSKAIIMKGCMQGLIM